MVGIVGLAVGTEWIALVGLILAVTAAGALAATLLVAERHQDERIVEEQGEAPALVLLGRDQPVERVPVTQSTVASLLSR